ncbi:hypothetical protein Ahy_A03g014212 [Arachis hypogaea]|uniref:Uncharacterized protein n=1 Tax=Arachis hypogaea TaxID=3818 RepID=A0A445DXH4_ARAHY|nr:hypothetical protein Ahy_A03g014212 [Arachis hypogaea]
MLEDVHEHHDHLTIWLCLDIKKLLYVHWETDEGFKRRYLTNRANKTSARSLKYTGESATFMKTKTKLRLEAVTQQSQCIGDDGNNFAASVVWREAASESYKNRMYELRSFFSHNLCTSTLTQKSASTTSQPVDPEDDVNLREQESKERYQEILSCMTDTNDFRLEWRWELEWLQWMERHMMPYEDQMRTGSRGIAGGSDVDGGAQTLPSRPAPQ